MLGGTRFRIDADIARQRSLSERIARAQSDIATRNRLQRASDDPAASARLGQLRRQATDAAAWRGIVDGGAALAARADGALGSVASLLDRARELATSAASDTLSAADRATIATELTSLADQVDGLAAETDSRGQRVFPDDAPLRLPVGNGLTLSATVGFAQAFTAPANAGPTTIASILRTAAAGVTGNAAGRATALSDVTAAADHIAAVRGEQGSRAARLDALADRLTDIATATEEERSSLADTDIAATVARLQADSLALEAAQAAFAKINRRTLFDLLG